jgi:hypothetical protein
MSAAAVKELEALVEGTDIELTKDEVARLEAPYRPKRVMGHF